VVTVRRPHVRVIRRFHPISRSRGSPHAIQKTYLQKAEGWGDEGQKRTGKQKISRLQGGQETSVSHVGSLCITFLLNRKLRNDRCVTFSDPPMTLFG